MSGFARNIVYIVFLLGKRGFRCGEKLVRARDGLRRRRFSAECSRTARAVEVMVPGDFFSFLMMLCFCVLHLRHFVHWNCCIEEMHSFLDPLEFEGCPRAKASFSPLQLVEFEGCLARKLRFHIFN